MPGKHVHFSEYATSTPSPAFSSSTLPSTPGPFTPPPLGFGSPYNTTPLPSDKNAVANPALAVTKNPVIEYDLTLPPVAAMPRTHTPIDIWAQPATKPLFPSVDVTCPLLPWKMTIHSRSKPYVTVGDLLEGLYRALRTPVTAAEYALLPTPNAQQQVSAAFHFRCKQIGDPAQQKAENAKGLKRVDFLGRHTQFRGIVWNEGLDGWTLMVS